MSDQLDAMETEVDRTLTALLPLETLLACAASDEPPSSELRGQLRELGWYLVALPEPRGLGLDAEGIARMAVLAGRHLLPAHVAAESFLFAPALDAAADGGSATAAAQLGALLEGRLSGGGGFLSGEQALFWLAPAATLAAVDAEDRVLLVDLERMPASPGRALDGGQGYARLGLASAAIAEVPIESVARLLRFHRLALISQAVGVVDAVLTRSVEYASAREQFGQPIAAFQAVAHQLSGIKVALDSGRSALARLVALIQAGDFEAADGLLDACAYAIPEAARRAVEDAIQVHGGMGFTWEYGLHLWYRRVLALQAALGGRRGAAARAGRHYLERRRSRAAVAAG